MKKDILAAITFLVTGLVFVMAQMEGKADAVVNKDADCVVTETILVHDALPTPPISEPVSRDS